MFEGQPKGLYALALANTGERFGYYTMLAIFTLFMQAKFGWSESTAGTVNAVFLAAVYLMPLLGGIVADKSVMASVSPSVSSPCSSATSASPFQRPTI